MRVLLWADFVSVLGAMKRSFSLQEDGPSSMKRHCAEDILTCVLQSLIPQILEFSSFELTSALSLVSRGFNVQVSRTCLSESIRQRLALVTAEYLEHADASMLCHALRASRWIEDLDRRRLYIGLLLRVPSKHARIKVIVESVFALRPTGEHVRAIVVRSERHWKHLSQDHLQRLQYAGILLLGQEYFSDSLFEDLCPLLCVDRQIPSIIRLRVNNLPSDHMKNQERFYRRVFPEFPDMVQQAGDIILHMIRLWCPDGIVPYGIWKINSKFQYLTGTSLVGLGFDRSMIVDVPKLVVKNGSGYLWFLVLLKERLRLEGNSTAQLIEAWNTRDSRISGELANINNLLESFPLSSQPFRVAHLDRVEAKHFTLYLVEMIVSSMSISSSENLIRRYLDSTDIKTSLILQDVITRSDLVWWTHQTIRNRFDRADLDETFFKILPLCKLRGWRIILLLDPSMGLQMLIWKDLHAIMSGNNEVTDDYSSNLSIDLIEPLVKIILKYPDNQMIGGVLSRIFPRFSEQMNDAFFLFSKK